jgi:UDP-2,3-diacylglucosamine pyrophosphatase LpxH
VFWVHASNAARFEQSFRDIADRVKIAGRRDPQANIYKLVHGWLCDCKQRWLLVLDNLDDARFLLDNLATQSKTVSQPLREYLPHCERGSILVTTRNKATALELVNQRDVVNIDPMDEAQALALFEKKLGAQGDSGDVAELAAALEYMPLAIVQAAAYISQRAPRYSVRKYLEEFKKNERKRSSLLSYDDGQLHRDWEAKNSIVVTWQISFEYIQQTRSSAADLLSLMSFFDRQGIPENLLRPRTGRQEAQTKQTERVKSDGDSDSEDDTSQSSAGDDQFEDDIVALRNFCFVSVDTSGTSFEMHALVQLATRRWLEANSTLEPWKQQFVSNLCAAFPTGHYENWTACQALYAHAKAALGQRPKDESSIAEWATVLYRAAWFAERMGNIADAEMLATKAMKARKKVLGQEHEDTLWSAAMVGLAYKLGGRWDEAEKLQVQVMETCKTKLGADHPNTLTSMANLASTYRNQGRWDEAEKLQVQVMEARKSKLGADHPNTLNSMNNLAATYSNQGRWDDAETLQVQVMEASKTKLGADHPNTLNSMNNLALTYRNQGRWDDAETLQVQVMETRKTKLGADHPDTLTSMNNLALTYRNQGRWDEAEKLQVQVMEASKRKLGADHPDTLNSMNNLAATYSNQGRWDDAETLQVQVMEASKTKLGADHPSTLNSMNNLALTYRNQGRWDDAETLQVQVMETRKTKLGADHPSTLTSMANLAHTQRSLGREVEAIELMRECVQLCQQRFRPNHPDLLSSLATLAQWEAEHAVANSEIV